jgi:hypothetical protein
MNPLTDKEVIAKRGGFLGGDDPKREPKPDEVFPILCGPWPNPNVGAIQGRCAGCNTFVGVSPRGMAFHRANPLRPLCCKKCLDILMLMLQKEMPHDATER